MEAIETQPIRLNRWLYDIVTSTVIEHSTDALCLAKEIKQKISEPYNFQHLTHAHARQFQELERTRDNELVSEFSAIRASQAPRRELRGIKADCLHSKDASPEALQQSSPPRSNTGLITPPALSPTRPHDRSRISPPKTSKEGKAVRSSPSIDNFSHPSPKGIKLPTPPVSPPPLRVSSKAAFASFHDPLLLHQPSPTASTSEQSIAGHSFTTSDSASALNSPAEITSAQGDIARVESSDIGHAVTTPDDSALTLRPLPFNPPGTELANSPEQVESFFFRRSPGAPHSRVPSTDSVIHHSKSSPPSLQRANSFLRPSLGVVSEAPGSPSLSRGAAIHFTLPDTKDSRNVLARPSSRTMSALPRRQDESWEDDIDWCYDHAAEADCEFEWDCQSRDGDEVAASSTVTAGTSTDALTSYGSGSEDNPDAFVTRHKVEASASAVADGPKSHMLASRITPDLAMPELEHSSTDSAQSSAISLPEAVAYSRLYLPPRFNGKSALKGPTPSLVTSPHTVYIPTDHEVQVMDEALYQEVLSEDYPSEHYFRLYDDSIHSSKAFDDSPRSSHSPPSTCQSRESVFLSGAEAQAKQRRGNSSTTSLPELIHSKTSRERFDLVAIQLAEHIAALTTPEAASHTLAKVSHQRKRSGSLAKEVAHQSILKKANSCGNLLECQNATATLATLSIHHGRAHSDEAARTSDGTSSQPAPSLILRRMRSAGAGALLSTPSYTLFPGKNTRGYP